MRAEDVKIIINLRAVAVYFYLPFFFIIPWLQKSRLSLDGNNVLEFSASLSYHLVVNCIFEARMIVQLYSGLFLQHSFLAL